MSSGLVYTGYSSSAVRSVQSFFEHACTSSNGTPASIRSLNFGEASEREKWWWSGLSYSGWMNLTRQRALMQGCRKMTHYESAGRSVLSYHPRCCSGNGTKPHGGKPSESWFLWRRGPVFARKPPPICRPRYRITRNITARMCGTGTRHSALKCAMQLQQLLVKIKQTEVGYARRKQLKSRPVRVHLP